MLKEELKESLHKNKNLSQLDRDIIPRIISDYSTFFKMYGIEFDSINTRKLLETLNFRIKQIEDEKVSYDSSTNTIVLPNNINISEEELSEIYEKSILSLMTTTYNLNSESYNEGLNFSVENKKYAGIINEKVTDRIHELVYGNIDDKIVTVPTVLDSLSSDIEGLIGSENLLTYFINGRGDLFYNKMSEVIGSEKETIDFFETLKEYESVDKNNMREINKIDMKYEKQFERILENKKVETLTM